MTGSFPQSLGLVTVYVPKRSDPQSTCSSRSVGEHRYVGCVFVSRYLSSPVCSTRLLWSVVDSRSRTTLTSHRVFRLNPVQSFPVFGIPSSESKPDSLLKCSVAPYTYCTCRKLSNTRGAVTSIRSSPTHRRTVPTFLRYT